MELKTDRLSQIKDMLKAKVSKAEIARQLGISRTRLYTILREDTARTKPNKR